MTQTTTHAGPSIEEQRLPLPPGVVINPGSGAAAVYNAYRPELGAALDAFRDLIVTRISIDKVTREVTRLGWPDRCSVGYVCRCVGR